VLAKETCLIAKRSTVNESTAGLAKSKEGPPDVESNSTGVTLEHATFSPSRPRDSAEFSRWYKEYRGVVRGLIREFIRDPHTVDDISQQAWFKISKAIDRYDPTRSKETTFVSMITRRVIIDHLRRHSSVSRGFGETRRDSPLTDELSDALFPHKGPSPLEKQEQREALEFAEAKMGALDTKRRSVLEQYCRGRTMKEISADLDMPLGSVKSLLWRTLARLRSRFP